MNKLTHLLTTHKETIVGYVRQLADRDDFVRHAHVDDKTCAVSVDLVTSDLLMVIEQCGNEEDACLNRAIDSMDEFIRETAYRHKMKKVPLDMFMGMAKNYRRAFIRLVNEQVPEPERRGRYTDFLARYFDQTEIALCRQWTQDRNEERQNQLELITDERNRFLSLFNSLTSPVFLLDPDGHISVMNEAAEGFLNRGGSDARLQCVTADDDGNLSGDRLESCSLKDVAPWLAQAISTYCTLDQSRKGCRFDTSTAMAGEIRHFSIATSTYNDIMGRFNGTTVVVDDVTQRVDAELELERERNMAATYLDVVGSIVLALDPSAAIMLLNKTGCEILGYESHEVVGKDWIETMIPMELRDETRERIQGILLSHGAKTNGHHSNYVTTKEGEHRQIEWTYRLLTNDDGVAIAMLASGTDVTERRRMEDALSEKELWLRNTFVSLGEAVLILTPDRRLLDGNPAAETMFDMTGEELVQCDIFDLHPTPDDSLIYEHITSEAFALSETAQFECLLMRKGGDIFPTENSVSQIMTDEGELLGIVHVIRDISERKKAETELKESEDKLSRIFDSISEGFVTTDMQGIVQMVNSATCKLLGYAKEELVGRPLSGIYKDQNERNGLLVQLAQHNDVHGIQLQAIRKDGTVITVEGSAHIIRDDDANPLVIEGTFRDITDRIQSEKILREREQQYRAFFEGSHAIMLLEDPRTGRIMDANPAACAFYGYTLDELRAMNSANLCALSDEDVFKEMWNARQEGRSSFIFRHQLANNEVRDVEVYSGPIQIRGNLHHYSIIHDVTSRVKLENDMKRLATTDGLTGTNNRHQFFLLAEQEFRRSSRYDHEMTVLMLDVDYFKSINDNHGHQVGDEVLMALVDATHATLRETDIFGRLGGEEFAAILPETDLEAAFQVADRLRTILSGLRVETSAGEEASFTVSIGVTDAREEDRNIEETLNRADEALYKAKRGGRDRVELN